MVISNFDEFDSIARNDDSVGFAIAMKSSKFKVVRFTLNGSIHAIEKMR